MPGLFGTSGANHARAVSSQTTFVADTEAGAGPSDPKDTAVDRELDPAAKRARLAELKQIAKEKKEAADRQQFLKQRAEREAKMSGNAYVGLAGGV